MLGRCFAAIGNGPKKTPVIFDVHLMRQWKEKSISLLEKTFPDRFAVNSAAP